jgi:phenylalanyl-tRNA synthetase alpha chain
VVWPKVPDWNRPGSSFLAPAAGGSRRFRNFSPALPRVDRPAGGRHFNEAKAAVTALFAAAQERLAAGDATGVDGAADGIDVTLPGEPVRLGHVHPITQTIRRVQEIMARLGFESVDGPEVEDQWHNFEALAIPAEHPARDPLDNFYLAVARGADPLLLRSQTSTVQIRVMENRRPPLRIVSLGRVYQARYRRRHALPDVSSGGRPAHRSRAQPWPT